MKYLKILSLAAVAAIALMAFLGAGSASASALCKTTPTTSGPNVGECPAEWDWPTNTVIDMDVENSTTVETLGGTVLDTCTGGTLKGKTTNTGSTTETVHGNIEELTWTGCTKTTDTIERGTFEIHTDPEVSEHDHNGTFTVTNTSWTINTPFGSCTYGTGAARDLGTLTHSGAGGTGENHATIDINTTIIKISGNAACPAEVRMTAKYTITEPWPLYVATGLE